MQTVIPALLIRRTYTAPPERVYEAWTKPQLARQFLCPEDVTISEVEMDVRVNGKYRIVMQHPEGELFVAYGVYREVVPATRLSMTWTWEEDRPEDEHESLLSVDFARTGSGGTELTLTHERLANLESRERHEHGWNSLLAKMEKL